MRFVLLVFACLVSASAADFASVDFLAGDWKATEGDSAFSFKPSLNGHVVVRTNYAVINGVRHEDSLTIYREDGADRAIYFDNEGHVIHYRVEAIPSGVVFRSERFRLTYSAIAKDEVRIRFEVAAPGKEFATYLEGGARRAR